MLSAHEFAMLMLAKDAADPIAERKELDTLLENQLAAMEQLAGDALRLRLSSDDDTLLTAPKRIH